MQRKWRVGGGGCAVTAAAAEPHVSRQEHSYVDEEGCVMNMNYGDERTHFRVKFIFVLLLVGILFILGSLPVDAHSSIRLDNISYQDIHPSNSAQFHVFLPIVAKRWPPIPNPPVLYVIENADYDRFYIVNWQSSPLADTYVLEEATDIAFSNAKVVYSGQDLSWSVSTPGKIPGTYYYRVKAQNSWGASVWSDPQNIIIYPLFVGLQVRWDGMGYIRGSDYYDVGWHIQRDLNEITAPNILKSHNYAWYDPNPQGWESSVWDSYYSITTGYFESSSIPGDPSWKWEAPWILPYDWRLENGSVISIDGQAFRVSGPHSGYTAFGKPIEYWMLVNDDKFLYWDGGGDWTQYVHAGDITLWYDAANSRLLIYRDILRREYYQGELTSDTVQYITNLTSANSFPDGNLRMSMDKNQSCSKQDVVMPEQDYPTGR
ncbi:MAG: hypothetical protein D6732_20420 [Methanobacteriota archaeon]|nr:MAG: hypothetical protein D6732_20420 [Euryarchaeota archaeon]